MNHLQGKCYFPNQVQTQSFGTGLEDLSNIIKLPQLCALELFANQYSRIRDAESLLT